MGAQLHGGRILWPILFSQISIEERVGAGEEKLKASGHLERVKVFHSTSRFIQLPLSLRWHNRQAGVCPHQGTAGPLVQLKLTLPYARISEISEGKVH